MRKFDAQVVGSIERPEAATLFVGNVSLHTSRKKLKTVFGRCVPSSKVSGQS